MVEFPLENYIDLDNNPYLMGRITVNRVAREYHAEVDIIHKESHKIFKHVAIIYRLSSAEEATLSGIQKLRRFLIELENEQEKKMATKFSVPDMNCGHCEKSIKEKLKDTTVKVDLKNKVIEVENKKPEEVIRALSEIGFDATVCN